MLKIIRAGMYTTVQDGGRHGFRQSGISHCGALDMPARYALLTCWWAMMPTRPRLRSRSVS